MVAGKECEGPEVSAYGAAEQYCQYRLDPENAYGFGEMIRCRVKVLFRSCLIGTDGKVIQVIEAGENCKADTHDTDRKNNDVNDLADGEGMRHDPGDQNTGNDGNSLRRYQGRQLCPRFRTEFGKHRVKAFSKRFSNDHEATSAISASSCEG